MTKVNNLDSYDHIEPLRSQRLGTCVGPFLLDILVRENTPWFESPADIEAGLAWGKKKETMLKQINALMSTCLSDLEQQSITLYFYENLNYRDAALRLHVNPSTVCRAVHRATKKLAVAVKESTEMDSE